MGSFRHRAPMTLSNETCAWCIKKAWDWEAGDTGSSSRCCVILSICLLGSCCLLCKLRGWSGHSWGSVPGWLSRIFVGHTVSRKLMSHEPASLQNSMCWYLYGPKPLEACSVSRPFIRQEPRRSFFLAPSFSLQCPSALLHQLLFLTST